MNPNPTALLPMWIPRALGVLLVLHLTSFWVNNSSPVWLQLLDGLWRFAIPALVAVWLLAVSRASEGFRADLWRKLAYFTIVFAVGSLTFALTPFWGTTTTAALTAPVFLFSWGFLIAMVAHLWRFDFPIFIKFRQTLDALGAMLSLVLILWWSYQGQMFVQYFDSAAGPFVAMNVFQAVMLTIALNVLFNPRDQHTYIPFLSLGILLFCATNIAFATAQIVDPGNTVIWWTMFGSFGFVLMAYAAWRSLTPQTAQTLERNAARINLLPPALFVITLLIALQTLLSENPQQEEANHIILLMFFGVALLVFLRQWIVNLENNRLNRDLKRFNQTLEQRVEERSQELEQSRNYLLAAERLASLGQLTAGLAHEVNTPLAAAMTSLKQADGLAQEYRQSIDHPQVTAADHREIATELGQKLEAGLGSLDRLGEIIRKMRAQTRQQSDGKTHVNLAAVLRDTLDLLQHPAMKAKVKLSLEVNGTASSLEAPPEVWLFCEPGRLSQVITNLVTNAIHACEEAKERHSGTGQHIWVSLKEETQHIRIEVQDDGAGIPEAVRGRIFEPLFTTKEAGRGTGLGLPIVRDIVVSNFGGNLDFQSEPGRGTTFSVILPKPLEAQHEGNAAYQAVR